MSIPNPHIEIKTVTKNLACMSQEQEFYGLSNWKCYLTSEQSQSTLLAFKQEQIKQENTKGFLVLFVETPAGEYFKVECYKKHSTSVIKLILIGKFPIPIYTKFRTEIDALIKQTQLLEDYIMKPEFGKYTLQRKLYFNID